MDSNSSFLDLVYFWKPILKYSVDKKSVQKGNKNYLRNLPSFLANYSFIL